MQSAFLRLTSSDWAKGAIVAVFAAIFAWLAQVFNAPGFDYTSFQWDELFKIAVGAFVAYMAKNLGTTENGKFLGRV